jgi:hypothetical protein
MAKFVKIKGYYLGYSQEWIERYVNPDFIVTIERSKLNPKHSHLNFDASTTMAVEMTVDEVLKLLKGD